MIKITNLSKSFGELKVLDDINLNIKSGDIYGLIGQSGAGKSTLLRCINGLETYDSGTLKVENLEVKDYEGKEIRKFRKDIGMIFQHFSLMERKTAYQNIALPLECWGYKNDEIDRRVRELLNLVGIEEKIDVKPRCLSGGQKQRVAIARALALKPKMLLCDEATSALDPRTMKSILSLLREINEKLDITIVVVTHQMPVIKQVCNKVAVLDKGEIVVKGEVGEVFLNQPDVLRKLLGEEDNNELPCEGVNVRITYSREEVGSALLARMARSLDLDFSLVWGKLEKYREDTLGSIVINIDQKNESILFNYLNDINLNWEVMENGP
ncbi:D-methionine transport system ATP-binding protein [Halanaerobium saccharolyticum]|uniref:D-methionine transport system ATP-binding protein n=1 Tax=Halanaerobium saccharolyticum TaxID=43595 RepID=A0A4R6LRL4_9FIRM|nr:methionine ABC transporter ATP-binding protein [Halanaerobium saccharolyticum]TDO90111.1 D-methionine transport system ATP-binding protein [Halanaerobium saccharolyticum]